MPTARGTVVITDITDGINSRPLTLYIKSTSTTAPASFTGTATYTFSTDSLTGLTLNGWTRTAPSITNGEYLWLREVVATSTTNVASIPIASWSASAIIGAGGVTGRSVYTAIVFRRSATVPAAPTDGSFNFGTNTLNPPSGWSLDVPAGTDPVYGTRFVFSIIGDSGSQNASTWSTPFKVAENGLPGSPGDPGSSGISTYQASVFRRSVTAPATPTGGSYNFGTQVLTAPAGWSTSVPTGTDPVYVTNTLASVQGVTGIDSTLTWSVPVVIAQNGTNGLNGESAWPATGNAVSGYNDLQSNASVLDTNVEYRLISSGVIATNNLATTTILHIGYSNANDLVQRRLDSVIVGDYVTITAISGGVTSKFAYIITSVNKRSNYTFNAIAAQFFYELGVILVKSSAGSSALDYATGATNTTFDFSRAVGTRGAGWWRYDAGATDLSAVDTTAEVNVFWVALHSPDIDPVKDDRFVIATTHVSGTKAFIYDGVNWVTQAAFVDGNLLVAGTVTANALSVNSVTADKIAANSVNADKIAANSITSTKLAASNVITTSAQISDGIITNAKIAETIQSTNFLSGSTGWQINKSGSAEFNGPVISRQLEVDTGDYVLPTLIDDSNANTLDLLRTFFIETNTPVSAWTGAKETYMALVGRKSGSQYGTVYATNTNITTQPQNIQWGWEAHVVPITRWSGNQRLWIKVELYTRLVDRLENFTLTWRLIKVT
jgi:hypothetical protein